MTPIAVVCWFMWEAVFPVTGWTAWTANGISVGVFTLFALGEYYGDTLPQTPNRTSVFPLIARIGFGALVGALSAAAMEEPAAGGVILGVIGALIGAYGGMWLRLRLAKMMGRDLPVAVLESALALGLAVLAMHELRVMLTRQEHEAWMLLRHGLGAFG
jgi:uncharacterized membrane protein